MVCPYCSTDMEPIELNGKVFCSNCGLTIKSGQPTEPVRHASQQSEKVEDVATNVPEEVQFPVVPEVAETLEAETKSVPDVVLPSADENPIATTPQEEQPEPIEQFKPITQAAEEELGLTRPETVAEPEQESVPGLESKIPDIAIPSESDFEDTTNPELPQTSYLELNNPGNEKEALDASSILLDILAEEPKEAKPATKEPRKLKVNILKDKPENPVEHPEIEPATTIPEEVKDAPETIDPKIEKKIENLEKKIEDLPEPEVEVKPEDANEYDPDTLDKAKAIKEYFDSAISETRNPPKKNTKKPVSAHSTSSGSSKKPKKKLKEHGPQVIFAITLAIVIAVLLGGLAYYIFTTFVRF